MHIMQEWKWRNHYTPRELLLSDPNRIVKIQTIRCTTEKYDWDKVRGNPIVFVTGDGSSLPNEVKEFESWGISHDLYCCNRSLLYFERQIDHWAAIDAEEAAWFSQNLTNKVCPDKLILRHTIGEGSMLYDVWWERVFDFTEDYQRRVWIGNTGYFAMLSGLEMGYSKVILAGMPLDNKQHWYHPEGAPGPVWNPKCYEQWEDFKATVPESANVRSMGGKTAEIFGLASKEWANGGSVGRIS